MRLLLVGPPGSGKGTQAKLLHERLGLAHIGMGDILREAITSNTPAGQLARPYMERGELVPDAIVNQMVEERFVRTDRPTEFVMDGYPRNRNQAIAFDRLLADLGLELELVVELVVPDNLLISRMAGRRICPQCKAVYHLVANPPRRAGVCDRDGAPLEQRDDDREETIRRRLEVYHRTSDELLEYYRQQGKLRRIAADKDPELVYTEIKRVLGLA